MAKVYLINCRDAGVDCAREELPNSLTFPDLGLRRFTSIPLIGDQAVGDVVVVNIAEVGDRFATDPL